MDMLEGPTSLLTFLGIQLNTMTMSLGFPWDKLASLFDLLHRTQGAKCIWDALQATIVDWAPDSYMPGNATMEVHSEQSVPIAQ